MPLPMRIHPSVPIPRRLSNRRNQILLGIVGGALLIRIGFAALGSALLEASLPISVDASSYHSLAQNLVERRIYTSPVDPPYNPDLPGTFRPPLTPFFLAAIYAVFGVNLFWGRLGLAVVSAFSCGLTFLLGERLFGRTVGIVAGIIASGYPFLLLLVHLPLTETLSIFLTLALLTGCYCYQPQRHPPVAWAIGLGILFGLLLLNKFINIVALPCLALWALLMVPTSPLKRVRLIGIIMVTAGAVILPWMLRNYRVAGFLAPVNTNGGWTFYLGNNPHTAQNLTALEQGASNGWIPPHAVFEPFADLPFNDTQAYERRAVQLALGFIRKHPDEFLSLAWRKVRIFWSAYPHLLDQMTWYPLAALSLIGIGFSLTAWKKYLLLYVLIGASMAIPVMFTAMPRFRAPLLPYVILFASDAVVRGARWYAHRS